MISLKDACNCNGQKKQIEYDEDTQYYFHVKCGFGFLWMMKYNCEDCDNPFISGRWLRPWHKSYADTEYHRLFGHLYDFILCPECREYYGHPKIAGSWSLR